MRKIKRNIEKKTIHQVKEEKFAEANNGFKKILAGICGGLLIITLIIFANQV
ncbi:hypothetical protein [Desulforamulus aquiferis]|uniref:Uncharacterized protein n=1 Tax=Desulforamulus aquiferis TaxID=1397668 RepID=A0AAW7Z7U9_9FIRM|nr:hypothetical protein [Desulforamulus aquiferis]MDO7785626.1 hypothetical protein [Desulforamulus aquiferis]RYD02896.1 hypothetical protein N752_23070 [Desulforamulus aquiferis]